MASHSQLLFATATEDTVQALGAEDIDGSVVMMEGVQGEAVLVEDGGEWSDFEFS